MIDTAAAYGNSEEILGNSMDSKNNFQIISKLPKQNKNIFTEEDQHIWEKNFSMFIKKIKDR